MKKNAKKIYRILTIPFSFGIKTAKPIKKMSTIRAIHPNFLRLLKKKDDALIDGFSQLRNHLLSFYPNSVELLYHTHALTSVFSVSEKLSDAFCMIPIYTNHFNLGFNKGGILQDPKKLLKGTGKLIRHIPITLESDYKNTAATDLIKQAIALAIEDCDSIPSENGRTISKIKK